MAKPLTCSLTNISRGKPMVISSQNGSTIFDANYIKKKIKFDIKMAST